MVKDRCGGSEMSPDLKVLVDVEKSLSFPR